jgi:LuxR family transcriptional regulator, maltose regulon positive regulatory protein
MLSSAAAVKSVGATGRKGIDLTDAVAMLAGNHATLSPPLRKGQLVFRQRLIDPFEASTRSRLSVIRAPAGFGKTALLTQVYTRLHAQGVGVAWLSLDTVDNEYRRFLKGLVLAVGTASGQVDRRLLGALDRGHIPSPQIASGVIGATLGLARTESIICIDDYHVISDPWIEELMSALVLNRAPHVSWIIASRTQPTHLPLGRLRLLNDTIEIGVSDLQFSDSEVECLVRTSSSLGLDFRLIHQLNVQAEGWAAGLQIALLGLRDCTDLPQAVARFSGSHRKIGEFLEDEVLKQLDPGVREFLLDVSVLSRLNTELCNCVTRRVDARQVLDQLEAMTLFVFATG